MARVGQNDFVADASGQCKFIGYSVDAEFVFNAARVPPEMNGGFLAL